MRFTSFSLLAAAMWFGALSLTGQTLDSIPEPGNYHVNYWISLPAIVGGTAFALYGHDRISDKDQISLMELSALDPDKVPGIDRISLRQDVDDYEQARKISDFGIQWVPLFPALLFLDKRMRHDAIDIAIVYAEAQVAVLNIYDWSFLGPTVIERTRPVSYYDEVDLAERQWEGNRNSFYSGHTSTVATTTFFMAKSYLDYHPEMRDKKWMFYGLASLPPVYFGIKRIQGLKHFPTDVMAGFVIGAAGGILIPELHKKSKGSKSISMIYTPEVKAMRFRLVF